MKFFAISAHNAQFGEGDSLEQAWDHLQEQNECPFDEVEFYEVHPIEAEFKIVRKVSSIKTLIKKDSK